jgi:hypothetical protein
MSKPKNKRRPRAKLSTYIGRKIDETSYLKIGLYLLLVILISSLLYWWLSPFKPEQTDFKHIGFLDSLYFSIATIATVGYGDISPIGIGRLIASCEILFGMVFISLFVGKAASERQSTLLLLTYTSEQQRRLKEFSLGIDEMIARIENALNDHDHDTVFDLSKESYNYLASISNYLIFQSNQGRLASFGNLSSLKVLYKSILDFQNISLEVIKLSSSQERSKNYFTSLSEKAKVLAEKINEFHSEEDNIDSILNGIKDKHEEILRFIVYNNNGSAQPYYRHIISEFILEKVLEELQSKSLWQKNIHKDIAQKLSISIKLSHECITQLITSGRIQNPNP